MISRLPNLHKLRSLKQYRHFNKALAGIGVILFAVVGTVLLFNSKAATPFASLEPENGSLSRPDLAINDTTASGGRAVQFAAAPAPSSGICTGRDASGGVPADKFPGAACTGVPPGVTLIPIPATGPGFYTDQFGYIIVDQPGTVLDSYDFNKCIRVYANNVTIKNSRIRCADYFIIKPFIDSTTKFTGTTVTDTEIDGINDTSDGNIGIKGPGLKLSRLNIHSFSAKAVQLENDSILEDSYIHDSACQPPLHQSGIGTNGGYNNIIMRHNNVDLKPNGDCISGGISNYHDFGTTDNLLMERNLINADNTCMKTGVVHAVNGAANSTNVRVFNNTFGRKYFPECAYYGPVGNWAEGGGNVWSGNVWGDGAAATSSHQTGDIVNPN